VCSLPIVTVLHDLMLALLGRMVHRFVFSARKEVERDSEESVFGIKANLPGAYSKRGWLALFFCPHVSPLNIPSSLLQLRGQKNVALIIWCSLLIGIYRL
jgi:hypothetical protein